MIPLYPMRRERGEGGRVRPELGQVRYNESERRWERYEARSWMAIVPEPVGPGSEIIVYELTEGGDANGESDD